MPTLTGITASPTTIATGGTSTVTVTATRDSDSPDQSYHVHGAVIGTEQAADILLTVSGVPGAPLHFTTDAAAAKDGDILVTCPDGGTLTATATAGVYTFSV